MFRVAKKKKNQKKQKISWLRVEVIFNFSFVQNKGR